MIGKKEWLPKSFLRAELFGFEVLPDLLCVHVCDIPGYLLLDGTKGLDSIKALFVLLFSPRFHSL